MVDLTTLARELVPLLAPALPYLLKSGEMVAEGATKKIGEDVWKWGKTLWDKLYLKVEAKPAALKAAQDVAATPEKEQAQNALAWQLEKLLNEDSTLAAELANLLGEAKGAGVTVIASGNRSVAIGGDTVDSTIITGDANVIGEHNTVNVTKS